MHGSQGSGKSFPVECFCEILGIFALANVDDLDKVFGNTHTHTVCVTYYKASPYNIFTHQKYFHGEI